MLNMNAINEAVSAYQAHAKPPEWIDLDLDALAVLYGISKEELIAEIKASPGSQGTVRLTQDGETA